MNKIEIQTRDGVCPSYVYRPAGGGPWPAVLVFMDGLGIRPAMLESASGWRLRLLRAAAGPILPLGSL